MDRWSAALRTIDLEKTSEISLNSDTYSDLYQSASHHSPLNASLTMPQSSAAEPSTHFHDLLDELNSGVQAGRKRKIMYVKILHLCVIKSTNLFEWTTWALLTRCPVVSPWN
jgi:hypothetical protein